MDIVNPLSYANRDEVIADSEEETEYAKSFSALPTLHTNAVSSISDFTTIAHGARSDEIEPHSIAERAKTRQRTQGTKKQPVVHDDVIELTSEDEVEKGTKSSAQSTKSKPKAKVKVPEKPLPAPSVITNSHIDSEPRPRVRPRPRPRPITKQARTKLDSDSLPPHHYPFGRDSLVYDLPGIQPPLTPTPPPCHRQPDLPIATSPVIDQAMPTGITSQLPPSDPPNSTMTTGIAENALPPIEILRDGESERDGDKPLSSPGSLFSDSGFRSKAKSKKRRREVALDIQDNEHEVDQLQPSSPYRLEETSHVALPVLDAYTHGPEPPPTFFAGSSSAGGHDGQRGLNAFAEQQADVIDLTDLTPTVDCVKPSKPNKNKKQKINTGPSIELGGDEGGSDFNPSGRKTAKKRKGKGKEPAKEKENKPKEKRTRKKKEQMDGVVLLARGKTGKTKPKAKQIEKEVFKSREIINDSDEDVDPLLLVGRMQVEGMPLPSTTDSMSSPKILDLNQGGLPSSSGKYSRSKVDEPNLSASAAAGSKEKATLRGKKRKSIVESDEEGPGEIQDKGCIVVKRRRSSGTILSDQVVEQERVDEKKNVQKSGRDKPEDQTPPRRSGVSRAVVSDDEVENRGSTTSSAAMEVNSKVGQRINVQKSGKENISDLSAPSAVRPLASRASTINPDVSTPLYARYEVAPRRSSLPMSELIRRASSKQGSPFPSFTPSHQGRSKGKRPDLDVEATCSASTTPLTTYSPYLKMSRRALSRIAPLHLNRKTPPPPVPPPPAKKKTKKELEREERWEEELVESVGGLEVWASMEDSERKEMTRAKREMEMGGYDD